MNTNIIRICFIMLAGFFWYACGEEEPIGQQATDSVPPGPVSNVQVKNVAGGALLSYVLPGDEDLLYVKAMYLRNGETCESRTSLYKDTLKLEGFGDMQARKATVIAVDRSRNESTPVTVTIEPLEPEVITIGETLDMETDFGGVNVMWNNINRAEISVVVLQESDSLMEYIPVETFYSSTATGKAIMREMDTVTYKLGVYVQDRWGNRSEVKYFEPTPLYETLFDRLKFSDATILGDAGFVSGWSLSRMWDGVWGGNTGVSTDGSGLPQSVTFDMGVLARISRIRIYQRAGGSYTFAEGNVREFEVWGSETLDLTGNWDSWTKLMECESIKPSGMQMGQNSDEDVARAMNGEDFFNSPQNPKVRYIRLKVFRSWAGNPNFQIAEIQIFGDNR
ncbi:MAG: DUF4959 domain-containing protein [Tannerella sp.]|nr:DUF4959 domain-containing protein [Tannerella sp.]